MDGAKARAARKGKIGRARKGIGQPGSAGRGASIHGCSVTRETANAGIGAQTST